LIICSPSESDGQSESHHAHRRQFPSVEDPTQRKTLDSISYGSGIRLADEMLAQARTNQLPSTRTEIGPGGELIDREKGRSYLVDTAAHPDYVTAEASSDRLALASQAGSLSLALDAADTIQAQDSLEKMLVHQITALHSGMMRATAQMNKELDAAGGTAIDAAGDKRDLTVGEREAANVRACRLAGAISRMSAVCQQGLLTLQPKRSGGN